MIVNLDNVDIINDNEIEITPFTMITGVNGSGKSAILNEIEKQNKSVKRYKWSGLSLFENNFKDEFANILLFEQPETGLHPNLQLKAIDLLLDLMKLGKTVVIETHSDHFLNRIVRRYLENEEIRNKVRVYFLDYNNNSRVSNVILADINPIEGSKRISSNFFEQFADETLEIINAAYKNMQKEKLSK